MVTAPACVPPGWTRAPSSHCHLRRERGSVGEIQSPARGRTFCTTISGLTGRAFSPYQSPVVVVSDSYRPATATILANSMILQWPTYPLLFLRDMRPNTMHLNQLLTDYPQGRPRPKLPGLCFSGAVALVSSARLEPAEAAFVPARSSRRHGRVDGDASACL